MKQIDTSPSFSDDRGDITDLIENETINAVTHITFVKDSIRANHYHKETTQWNYLLDGKLLLRTQMPDSDYSEVVMEKGDLIEVMPNESHAFKALENSSLVVFTKGPRGGKEYESDTFRLDKALL